MTTAKPSRFYLLVVVVFIAAVAILLFSWVRYPPQQAGLLLLFVVAAITAENLAVELPMGGSTSIAYPISFAALLLLGPTAGALSAAFSGLSLMDIRQRKPFPVVVFNVSQLAVSAGVSGLAYVYLVHLLLPARSGVTLLETPFSTADFPVIVVPLVSAALLSVVINATLVAGGIWLYRGVPFRTVWLANVAWTMPTQLALAALGAALAQVVATIGPLGFALFVVPLIVTSQVYQHYMFLKGAYADSVRSLVAAIEAKDPYTKGHSERVAEYTLRIATAMGFEQPALEQLEIAALLHDLGKLGISRGILSKPGSLDADEFGRIREHPRMGAHIVESVSFLAEIVPVILYHHERVDGKGYGEGLRGQEIPLEARILAVADSYDAMTSVRPYRDALTLPDAIEEIRNGAGSQFDKSVVAAFLPILQEELAKGSPTMREVVDEVS